MRQLLLIPLLLACLGQYRAQGSPLYSSNVRSLPSVSSNGTSGSPVSFPGMCKSDKKHIDLMMNNPAYAAKRQEFHQSMMDYLSNNNSSQRALSGTVTIPVVVHIIHLGEAEGTGTNISDAQIQSAIDNLNDAYANTGYNGLDTEIQFVLAARDENCSATDGINRINGTGVSGYSTDGITDANETDVKALSKWDNYTYYNIWVVSEIDGNDGGAGTQGYAYFPGASSSVDGAVVLYNAFGYDPTGALGYNLKSYTNYNVTTIHELGHGLDLYHTFQGDDGDGDGTADQCPANGDPTTDGDLCADTDAHRRDDSDCDAIQNTCHGVSGSTVYNNFMAYSSDDCQDRFTSDQKDRMRAALELERPGLITSLGGTAPTETGPIAATCSVDYTTPNSFGMGITDFEFNTIHVVSGTSQNDEGYHDRTCAFKTDLTAGSDYDLNIELGPANNQDIEVWIDYNNDGDFEDANENVFSGTSDVSFSGVVSVPSSGVTLDTYLRMRVTVDWFGNTISGSCYNPQYGEVEEYAVMVSSTCTDPDFPVLSGVGSVCDGGSATIDITGDLNSASQWVVYTGSCGGTQVTTTSGSSFDVTPSGPSTTYFVRGEGGCVTPGICNEITLNVTDVDDASFNYDAASYCQSDSDPTPTITGDAGGTFTFDPAGLVINGSTGEIDVSASTAQSYTVTYTTAGVCPDDQDVVVEIQSCAVVPNAYLRWKDRGKTMATLNQNFYSTHVSNATQYEWQFTPQSGGGPVSVIMPDRRLTLAEAGLLDLNETYDVQVRAHVGGDVGSYATAFELSSPGGVPDAQLRSQDCGITVGSFSDIFYSSYVGGATQFEFRFTPQSGGGATTVFSPTRAMTLNDAGLTETGETYDVQVRAHIGSDIGSFGVVCELTAPGGVPAAKLRSQDCGITLNWFSQTFYANFVAGATQFEFRFTPQSGGAATTVFSPTRAMTLNDAGLTAAGETYDVEVRAYIGAEVGTYGVVCELTSPGSAIIIGNNGGDLTEKSTINIATGGSSGLSEDLLSETTVYPNPFKSNVSVDFGGNTLEKEIRIYNSLGQLMKSVKTSDAFMTLEMNDLKVGVYMMQVISGGEIKTIRLVKQ